MKGIIIAGGLGTRLRPLTYYRPKPLVPVANRPFLEYQVALLRQHGIDDIVFATNYMADRIEAHFGDGSRFGVRMRFAIEESPLGTGGAIRNAADLFPGEAVCVFNGDILTDFDIRAILDFHSERNAMATITLAPIPRPHPFGVVTLGVGGRVGAWLEPSEETKRAVASGSASNAYGTDLINAGFYVLERECIDTIPVGVPRSVERDIYPALLAEGAPIYGVSPGGFWMDVGRPEQFLAASEAILSGSAKTAIPGLQCGVGASVAPGADIGALTSIGANTRVGAGSRVERCILMDNVSIGANVRLSGLVVDDNVTIEEDVTIEASVGRTPVLSAGSIVRRGTKFS